MQVMISEVVTDRPNVSFLTYRNIIARAFGPALAAASSSLANRCRDRAESVLRADAVSAGRVVPLPGSLLSSGVACRADLSGSSSAKIKEEMPVMRICGKTINKLCMPCF